MVHLLVYCYFSYLPPRTPRMTVRKEFTRGHWRDIELYASDQISEVFQETMKTTLCLCSHHLERGVTCVTHALTLTLSGRNNAQCLTFH